MESISEDTTIAEIVLFNKFLPTLRSGEWSDIGGRLDMEDTHICIADLAKNFGHSILGEEEAISFYGVSSLNSFGIMIFILCNFLILLVGAFVSFLTIKFSLGIDVGNMGCILMRMLEPLYLS